MRTLRLTTNTAVGGTKHTADTLPTRRRKDSDTENDRENGLRMNNKMTMKQKKIYFFCRPARKKSGKPTHIWHIAFCPTHKPTLRKSQRAKSCRHTIKII